MSFVAEINAFLETTRTMTVEQLNTMIAERDATAEAITNASVAHAVLGYMESARIKGQVPSFADAFQRASALKEGQPFLFTADEPESKPAADTAAAALTAPAAAAAAPAKVKKSEQAQAIFDSLTDKSKPNVIKVFMEQLGTTAAGAQTYYYACGGEKLGRRGRPAGEGGAVAKREGPTKADRARALFAEAPDKSRAAIIKLFMEQLEMSKAGATTYYYTVGGEHIRAKKAADAAAAEAGAADADVGDQTSDHGDVTAADSQPADTTAE